MKHPINHSLNKITIFAIAALTAFAEDCIAGLPSGPYLVWSNLHQNSKPQITDIIASLSNTQRGSNLCGSYAFGHILYIKNRPSGMNNNHISLAMNQRDKSTSREIIKKLINFRDPPVNEGLDGIIAYSEQDYPHMISIDTRGKIKSSKRIQDTDDPKQISYAFCDVMPEIYRK